MCYFPDTMHPHFRFLQSRSGRIIVSSLLYFAAFCLLTFPWIGSFSTHFFTDTGDGLQNVWNIWWIHHAVTELQQNPWRTTYLHYPAGTTLLAHTLNPFNGFACLVLLKFMSLIQAFNVMVILSFVVGGLTSMALAYHVTRSAWASWIGGFVFTFANYHFAHAQGHMQLVSLEWIPLFVLAWINLLERPAVPRGIGAAGALFLVLLCDYYYFFYSVLFALLWFAIRCRTRKDPLFLLRPNYRKPFAAFLATASLSSGAIVFALLNQNRIDPIVGSHDAREFSLDLLALIIPGGYWRFNEWTRFYWSRLPGNVNESSVHLGLGVLTLLVLAWSFRNKLRQMMIRTWMGLFAVFAVLSMGPFLHISGRGHGWFKLPYALLELLIPPLRMSGCPVRMVIMSNLCASVLVATALQAIFPASRALRTIGVACLALMVFEFIPRPLPLTNPELPKWVKVLKEQPSTHGLLDTQEAVPYTFALYYQTIHQIPMAWGYVSRLTKSVLEQDLRIRDLIKAERYRELCEAYGFRYLLLPKTGTPRSLAGAKLLISDVEVDLLDVGSLWNCRR